jgi:hypothetical protein
VEVALNKLVWAARVAPLLILPFFLSADVGAESQIKIEIGAAGYFYASNPSGGEPRYSKGYIKTQSDDAHISRIKYQPGRPVFGNLTLNLDWDLQPAAVDWLNDASNSLTARKSVSIIAYGRDRGANARTEMLDVNLAEVIFPGPDINGTKPEVLKYKLQAGFIYATQPPTDILVPPPTKSWLPSNFRFGIAEPGLESKAVRIIKCEPYGFTTNADDDDGDGLPNGVEVRTSDLVVQVPPEEIPYFESWLESFRKILDTGEAGDFSKLERQVTITYILSDKTEVDVALLEVGPLAVTRNGKGAEVRMYSGRVIVRDIKKPNN